MTNSRDLLAGYRTAEDQVLYVHDAFIRVVVDEAQEKIKARSAKTAAADLAVIEEQMGIWDAFARKADDGIRSAEDAMRQIGGGYLDLLAMIEAKRAAVVYRARASR